MARTSSSKPDSSVVELGGKTKTVALTGERIEKLSELTSRLESALSAAPQVIASIDAATGKCRESAKIIDDKLSRLNQGGLSSADEIKELHQAREKADRVKTDLTDFVRQLADVGDASEEKVSLLLEALDASAETRENLQTIATNSSDQVAQFERRIEQHTTQLHELSEMHSQRLEEIGCSADKRLESLLSAQESRLPKTAGSCIAEIKRATEEQISDIVRRCEGLAGRASGIEEKCDDQIRRIESTVQEQKALMNGIIEQQTAALEKSIAARMAEARKQEEAAREHTNRVTELSGIQEARIPEAADHSIAEIKRATDGQISDIVRRCEGLAGRASGIEEKCDDQIRRIESTAREQKALINGIMEQQTAALEESIAARMAEVRTQEEAAREHTNRMAELSDSRTRRMEESIGELRSQLEYAGQVQEQKMAAIADRLTTDLNNIFDKEIAKSRQELEKLIANYSSSGPHITQLHENVEQAIRRLNRTGSDQVSKIQQLVERHISQINETVDAKTEQIASQQQASRELLEKASRSTGEVDELLSKAIDSRRENESQIKELTRLSGDSVELTNKLCNHKDWVQPALASMKECAEGSDATIKKIETLIQDVWTLTTTCQDRARQLTERCEAAETVADRIDKSIGEAQSQESALDARCAIADKHSKELIGDVKCAGETIERIHSSCEQASKSLEKADEAVYKAQAVHQTIRQLQSIATDAVTKVESTVEAARESVQQMEGQNSTAKSILSSMNDSIIQIERAEKEAATKVALLGTQNLEAQRKAEVLVSALSRSREIIERIESSCEAASRSASVVEEKTGTAQSVHESLVGVLANSADAIRTINKAIEASSESGKHIEDRSRWAKDLIRQMESGVVRVEQAEKEAASRAETLGAQNLNSRRRTEELVDALARSNETIEQLDAGCERASQSASEIEEASGAGRSMHDALAGLLSNAEGVSEKIKAATDTACDRTARIEDRNRAASDLLQRMETTAESYGNLSNEIRTRCEEARQVSKTVTEALKQGAKIKAELDLTNERSNRTSRDAAQMLATMVEHRQILETGEQALNEFLERAESLRVQLQQLQTRGDSFCHQLNGMLADPRKIIDEAKIQSGQLDSVCRAVRKVFSGLSQVSLQANRDITRFAQISRDANGRLTQLSAETQRAGQTLREWVEEATHVQSRLSKSIAQVPPLEQTHPTTSITDLGRSGSEAIAEILRNPEHASGMQRQNLRPKGVEPSVSKLTETKGDFGTIIREAEDLAEARR